MLLWQKGLSQRDRNSHKTIHARDLKFWLQFGEPEVRKIQASRNQFIYLFLRMRGMEVMIKLPTHWINGPFRPSSSYLFFLGGGSSTTGLNDISSSPRLTESHHSSLASPSSSIGSGPRAYFLCFSPASTGRSMGPKCNLLILFILLRGWQVRNMNVLTNKPWVPRPSIGPMNTNLLLEMNIGYDQSGVGDATYTFPKKYVGIHKDTLPRDVGSMLPRTCWLYPYWW